MVTLGHPVAHRIDHQIADPDGLAARAGDQRRNAAHLAVHPRVAVAAEPCVHARHAAGEPREIARHHAGRVLGARNVSTGQHHVGAAAAQRVGEGRGGGRVVAEAQCRDVARQGDGGSSRVGEAEHPDPHSAPHHQRVAPGPARPASGRGLGDVRAERGEAHGVDAPHERVDRPVELVIADRHRGVTEPIHLLDYRPPVGEIRDHRALEDVAAVEQDGAFGILVPQRADPSGQRRGAAARPSAAADRLHRAVKVRGVEDPHHRKPRVGDEAEELGARHGVARRCASGPDPRRASEQRAPEGLGVALALERIMGEARGALAPVQHHREPHRGEGLEVLVGGQLADQMSLHESVHHGSSESGRSGKAPDSRASRHPYARASQYPRSPRRAGWSG